MRTIQRDVRFTPQKRAFPDASGMSSLCHGGHFTTYLITSSARAQRQQNREPEQPGSSEIDHHFEHPRRSGVRLHLNSDAVDRLPRSVENPSKWLRRHVCDQTSLTIPILDRLHDISVRRQFGAIWSKIVYWPLDLVEHKHRRPSMMMDGLFVVWLQGHLKHAKPLVLEDDFVMFGAATTTSNAGSQVDESKSVRLSAMLPSPVQLSGSEQNNSTQGYRSRPG
jgi:hypothetical protein